MKKLTGLFIASICLSNSFSACADSPWLTRVRAIDVIPEASSNTISLIGGKVTHISSQVTPELDFSYFFTRKIAAELILATTQHSARATNTALGTVNLGKVYVLPPTLTLQYHFLPARSFNPYVGAGINYTHFYHVTNGPVSLSTSYGDSVGPALQIGADLALNNNWSLNVDVKQIFMWSNVKVNTALGQLNTHVTINPVVVGVGLGYRFS
ncbi:OmpW/AlkL family protein [Legionella fallonii]|uniref:Outer membrane protein, OmpW n=1 Tax=Legionella fallonii LLAP-10 TaxID=1212491 RepID=A0A098G8P5_9GAMM|nr:OmpW family outer membrane protein [Legionella fallonii]CEG58364.1 Outer membrane protein, OmpW [Legionella fallonii LLAP-10]